jgi:LTXXQ motif family protein
MLKILAIGLTALAVTSSSSVYAQTPAASAPDQRLTQADLDTLTDARIAIVKAALQLTPDQEKLWPAVEDAVRSRAMGRQARRAELTTRIAQLHERNRIEILRDFNPVEFLRRRSDALAERSAELKKLADAWQPLYATLNVEQKRRLAVLTVFALREMRGAAERGRFDQDQDED